MILTGREWAVVVGIVLAQLVLIISARAYEEFDPLIAATMVAIGGIGIALLLVASAVRRRSKTPQDAPTPREDDDEVLS